MKKRLLVINFGNNIAIVQNIACHCFFLRSATFVSEHSEITFRSLPEGAKGNLANVSRKDFIVPARDPSRSFRMTTNFSLNKNYGL